MKKKEYTDLKDRELKDLRKLLSEKKHEAGKKLMEASAGKEKNLKAAGSARRDIAQVMTLIREKEIIEIMTPVIETKEEKKEAKKEVKK